MELIRKKGVKGFRIASHNKKVFYAIVAIVIILLAILIYLIFNNTSSSDVKINDSTSAQIANPAAVYCIDNNGTLQIKDSPDGQYSLCVFNDGSSCEEWEYFRGECGVGQLFNECSSDSDCVPASCCHPTSCVSASNAPICNKIACTMDCKPATLDCGQGKCLCSNGKCGASLVN